jgi:hypothetical protein
MLGHIWLPIKVAMLKWSGGLAGKTGEVPGPWRMAAAIPHQAGDDGRWKVTEEDAGGMGTPSWWLEQRVAHHGRLPAAACVGWKRTSVRWGQGGGGRSSSG